MLATLEPPKVDERETDEARRRHLMQLGGLRGGRGSSPEHYKQEMALVKRAAANMAALDEMLRTYKAEVDEAERIYNEETASPLSELEASETPVKRRVELRTTIDAALSKLKATTDRLKPLIAATEKERQFQAVEASQRQVIENAYADLGPQEENDRVRVLKYILNDGLLMQMLVPAEVNASRAQDALRLETESERKSAASRGREPRPLVEMEHKAKLARDVLGVVLDFKNQMQKEVDGIRARRIAELYSE